MDYECMLKLVIKIWWIIAEKSQENWQTDCVTNAKQTKELFPAKC